ncbi:MULTISPECIES: hypothetical protein [Amycolatopsis]|uniref:hypothetical protein n=1 Tax=Amycolatopsis TaxID=1813 RepID=UPI0017482E21|nr:hypothetical protein [Amycolatopsis bullii]
MLNAFPRPAARRSPISKASVVHMPAPMSASSPDEQQVRRQRRGQPGRRHPANADGTTASGCADAYSSARTSEMNGAASRAALAATDRPHRRLDLP